MGSAFNWLMMVALLGILLAIAARHSRGAGATSASLDDASIYRANGPFEECAGCLNAPVTMTGQRHHANHASSPHLRVGDRMVQLRAVAQHECRSTPNPVALLPQPRVFNERGSYRPVIEIPSQSVYVEASLLCDLAQHLWLSDIAAFREESTPHS